MVMAVSWVVGVLVDVFQAEATMVSTEVNKVSTVVVDVEVSLPFTCTISTFVLARTGVKVMLVLVGAS